MEFSMVEHTAEREVSKTARPKLLINAQIEQDYRGIIFETAAKLIRRHGLYKVKVTTHERMGKRRFFSFMFVCYSDRRDKALFARIYEVVLKDGKPSHLRPRV